MSISKIQENEVNLKPKLSFTRALFIPKVIINKEKDKDDIIWYKILCPETFTLFNFNDYPNVINMNVLCENKVIEKYAHKYKDCVVYEINGKSYFSCSSFTLSKYHEISQGNMCVYKSSAPYFYIFYTNLCYSSFVFEYNNTILNFKTLTTFKCKSEFLKRYSNLLERYDINEDTINKKSVDEIIKFISTKYMEDDLTTPIPSNSNNEDEDEDEDDDNSDDIIDETINVCNEINKTITENKNIVNINNVQSVNQYIHNNKNNDNNTSSVNNNNNAPSVNNTSSVNNNNASSANNTQKPPSKSNSPIGIVKSPENKIIPLPSTVGVKRVEFAEESPRKKQKKDYIEDIVDKIVQREKDMLSAQSFSFGQLILLAFELNALNEFFAETNIALEKLIEEKKEKEAKNLFLTYFKVIMKTAGSHYLVPPKVNFNRQQSAAGRIISRANKLVEDAETFYLHGSYLGIIKKIPINVIEIDKLIQDNKDDEASVKIYKIMESLT